MKYALDRIEENIAILENIQTGEKRKISIFKLPKNLHEGIILKKENNTYIIDNQEEEKRRLQLHGAAGYRGYPSARTGSRRGEIPEQP